MARGTLVLLPGLLCDERLFAPQLGPLRAAAEVTIGDLTRDEGVTAMAARVLAEAPPGRFALAGLSMGGYVALEIVRQGPDRVSRLALLDTQARPDTAEATARRRTLMATAARDGGLAGVTSLLLPLLLHDDRLSDAGLTGTVHAMADAVGAEAFARQQRAIVGRPDSRPSLGTIEAPTLVLAGWQDAITPPELQLEMARAIPDATLALVPRCGHLSTLERPEAVTRQLLAWLAV